MINTTDITIKELWERFEEPPKDFEMFCCGTISKNSPVIKPNVVKLLKKDMSYKGLYSAYQYAFGEKVVLNTFSDDQGVRTYWVEDSITGAFCVVRKNKARIDIGYPADPDKEINMLSCLAVQQVIMDYKKEFNVEDIDIKYDALDTWTTSPNEWKLKISAIYRSIRVVSETIERLISRNGVGDKIVHMHKIEEQAELVLPVQAEKSFGAFKNPKNLAEYEDAQTKVAELFEYKRTITMDQAIGSIPLIDDVEMTEEMQAFIPTKNEPRFKNGIVFQRWMFELISAIVSAATKVRNVMLYGPAGTGKTTVTRILGLILNMPVYSPIVCSSDMRKEGFIGEFSFENGQIVWHQSPLIQAVRYGGIIEIQEPSCIRDPGTLTCLNNILDPCGMILIPETGEVLRRDKNCIIVLTTNQGYAGCRQINASVLSRMQYTKYIPGLTVDEYVERIKREPQVVLPEEVVRMMAVCFVALIEAAVQDGLYGDTSYRTFRSWVELTYLLGDPNEAAESTVIDKICFSSDETAEDSKQKLRSIISSSLQMMLPINKPTDRFDSELSALESLVID